MAEADKEIDTLGSETYSQDLMAAETGEWAADHGIDSREGYAE